MRTPVPAVAAAILLSGPTAVAFFSGGFFDRPRLIAGMAAWALAVVGALRRPRGLPRGRRAWIALAALAAYAAWTALSYSWAPLGQRAQGDIQRVLGYVGLFLAAMVLLRGGTARRLVEPALAAGTWVVTAYGLGDRLLPGLVTYAHSRTAEGRLEQPLTYWNGMGCLAAIGLVLCLRIAADDRRRRVTRAFAAAAGPTLGLGVFLTFSRGSLFALAGGVLLLVLLTPSRGAQLRVSALVLGAGAVSSGVASQLSRVESLPMGQQGSSGQGLGMLLTLVSLSLVCAVVSWLVPALAKPAGEARGPRSALGAALVAVVLLGGLLGAAAIEGTPKARPGGSPTSATRFASTDTLRYSYWGVALDAFARDPLRGTGTGGFATEWRRRPGEIEQVVDAHSLYVETLSELGLVGVALLALFLGAVASAAFRLHRTDAAGAAGPAAAALAYAVHAGLDWDWEIPALTAIALILAACLVAWDDELAG